MNASPPDSKRPFRFFDNREKYLLFVTTCAEKWAVAERVGRELARVSPRPPALRLFDAGTGDGTVLASVLRQVHERFPTVPLVVVGKEISLEDVRMTLSKLPDRLAEHPRMVVVVTNMHYAEAPVLWPATPAKQAALNWQEVALEGTSAHEFDQHLDELRPLLQDWWKVRASERTGNPLYVRPSVLVIYRQDQRFTLDGVLPRLGEGIAPYDLVVAAQPYRARQPAETKVRYVLEPLARSLAPGGRMVAVQSTGQDPGMEIIRKVWPQEDPFLTPAPMLAGALLERLQETCPEADYRSDSETHTLFRYGLYARPGELAGHIPTSTLLAAWNAAVYVAQIDDARLAETMSHGDYLEATREVLARHRGLWFIDESFVVTRPAE
jgi:hypothetical protein